MHRRRDHGGLIFVDLRDRTGLLQLVVRGGGAAATIHERAEELRSEYVLSAPARWSRARRRASQPQPGHR